MKSLLAAAIALTATAALAGAPSAPTATPRVDFAATARADAPVVASETIALPPLHIIAERPTGGRVVAMAPMVIVADRPTTAAAAPAFEVIALPALHITARPERTAVTSIAAVTPSF